jgi:formamidopyrimidine-DNA glycosylase
LDERWTRPNPPAELIESIDGRPIESVQRRGKYLLVGLDGDRWLAMHLRMTGNLLLVSPRSDDARALGRHGGAAQAAGDATKPRTLGGPRLYEPPPDARHLRAAIDLDDGSSLWFTDPRRFGHAIALDGEGLEEYLEARLGIEPLSDELTAEAIGALSAGRRAPLKSFLLAQEGIAGIGNIYADEALHRAELHPLSPAGATRPEHWESMRAAIVDALETGIRLGGASIDDYRDVKGEAGAMQTEFLVHAREDEPCPRCGEKIRRIVVSGRSTYFCPACQKRLRRRPRRRGTRSRSSASSGSGRGAAEGSREPAKR